MNAIIETMNTQTKTLLLNWLGTGSLNIFGRPFSGKDTQGRILADLLEGALIGGGDILRSHQDPKNIEKVMAEGGIIPSDFYLDMIPPYLSRAEFKDKPLILSAVGRAHGEEPAIMQAADESGHPIKAVILLDISEEEVWQRFDKAQVEHDRGNRNDDNREVLNNRLKKFRERTMPVIEFYRDKGLLVEVNGTFSRDQVTNDIIDSLLKFASV
jgi:adenylate kinase